MKNLKILFVCLLIGTLFSACLKDEDNEKSDKEKNIVMIIYPETGYGASVLSDVISQPLIFSENDDTDKQLLTDIITEGFDFDYERGYKYTLKVKKVWMADPPQDVSSIKYIFIDLLSKEKVITEDSEKTFELSVAAETVRFTPNYPPEYNEDGSPVIYDAMRVMETGAQNSYFALTAIEGFDYEEGYEYLLDVKKVIQAEPYSVQYILLSVLSKNEKD
jgi:hypothetical protein